MSSGLRNVSTGNASDSSAVVSTAMSSAGGGVATAFGLDGVLPLPLGFACGLPLPLPLGLAFGLPFVDSVDVDTFFDLVCVGSGNIAKLDYVEFFVSRLGAVPDFGGMGWKIGGGRDKKRDGC